MPLELLDLPNEMLVEIFVNLEKSVLDIFNTCHTLHNLKQVTLKVAWQRSNKIHHFISEFQLDFLQTDSVTNFKDLRPLQTWHDIRKSINVPIHLPDKPPYMYFDPLFPRDEDLLVHAKITGTEIDVEWFIQIGVNNFKLGSIPNIVDGGLPLCCFPHSWQPVLLCNEKEITILYRTFTFDVVKTCQQRRLFCKILQYLREIPENKHLDDELIKWSIKALQ